MKQPVKRQILYKKQHRTAATRSFRKCLIYFLIKILIIFERLLECFKEFYKRLKTKKDRW